MSVRFSENQLDVEDEDVLDEGQDESQDELPNELPRIQPRPARASLTHHAIKTELMKLNNKKEQQRLTELTLDSEEDNLSRAARKRKRRREKVLEERRASGRSEDLDEDFANFKSISIARRRSSVLPINAIFHHHQGSTGCASYPHHSNGWSRLRRICWWLLVLGALVGSVIYLWPLLNSDSVLGSVAEDGVSSQSPESSIAQPPASPIENQYGDPASGVEDELAVSDDQEPQPDSWSLLQLLAAIVNSVIPDSEAELGDWTTTDNAEQPQAELTKQTKEGDEPVQEEAGDEDDEEQNWNIAATAASESVFESEIDEQTKEGERVPIELDLQSAKQGQHIETSFEDEINQQSYANVQPSPTTNDPNDDQPDNQEENLSEDFANYGWFWSSKAEQDTLYDEEYESTQEKDGRTADPSTFHDSNIHELSRAEQVRQQMEFDEEEARRYVDQLVKEEQQLDQVKAARQHLVVSEQELFECETDGQDSVPECGGQLRSNAIEESIDPNQSSGWNLDQGQQENQNVQDRNTRGDQEYEDDLFFF